MNTFRIITFIIMASLLGTPAAAVAASNFPSNDELSVFLEKIKAFEIESREGKLNHEELNAFMAITKSKFPCGEEPRQLLENDPQFNATQQEIKLLIESINPAEMKNPVKLKEFEVRIAPFTLKLMRRTLEVVIENDWKPPGTTSTPVR